jgi:hypothetical protein
MTAIQDAADLSAGTKRHWVCSLRQIAKWLDRPVEVTPARWTAIRLQVGQLHHARLGVTAKTVANHKSNAAAALRWFGKSTTCPRAGWPCPPSGRCCAMVLVTAVVGPASTA